MSFQWGQSPPAIGARLPRQAEVTTTCATRRNCATSPVVVPVRPRAHARDWPRIAAACRTTSDAAGSFRRRVRAARRAADQIHSQQNRAPCLRCFSGPCRLGTDEYQQNFRKSPPSCQDIGPRHDIQRVLCWGGCPRRRRVARSLERFSLGAAPVPSQRRSRGQSITVVSAFRFLTAARMSNR